MNIVKGVAGFLRKPITVHQVGEIPVASSQVEGSSKPPWLEIQFGMEGDEAILELEWEKYENSVEKEEKENTLQAFLLHFLEVFEDWRPCKWDNHTLAVPTISPSSQDTMPGADAVRGCAAGHPTRVILALIQEMKSVISLLMELQSMPDPTDASPSPVNMERGLRLLDVLRILTRSIHNQKIFSYYGGFQTLVALMKAAVVQMKAVTGGVSIGEPVPYSFSVQMSFVKCLLAHVVSIVSNFIDINSHNSEKCDISSYKLEQDGLRDDAYISGTNTSDALGSQSLILKSNSYLKQRDTIPLMETGGLNWFVELLRVLRRLRLKSQMMEVSLEQLTLRTLKSALIANPRAQNHFRSIGGLQVLVDGLGIPDTMSGISTLSKRCDQSYVKRAFEDFQLQILSLELLREAVYGNLNSLQFLFDNGGIKKFTDIICWSAFVFPLLELRECDTLGTPEHVQWNIGSEYDRVLFPEGVFTVNLAVGTGSSIDALDCGNLQRRNCYVARLSRILCSFLVPAGEIESLSIQFYSDQSVTGVSVSYLELATKWILKVLLSVFPCKWVHCNNDGTLIDPRILCGNLQYYILYVFRKILTASPALLQTFREEGVWDMLFSEYFFYFKLDKEGNLSQTLSDSEASGNISPASDLVSKQSSTDFCSSKNENSNLTQMEILQMDVISFVEFAATINGSIDNVPECSVLMDALEKCACLPQIAIMIVKSLHRILQLAADATISSFEHLDAIARFSKVICRQMEDFAETFNISASSTKQKLTEDTQDGNGICERHEIFIRCMEAVFSLFAEYFSISEDAKFSALCDPGTVDNLFTLLWKEHSRKFALNHILDLIKLPPLSEKDQEAKLGLCFKYFETFPCIKETDWKVARNISADLLAGVRDILQIDMKYFQALFRDGECFLHIVTLLNGNFINGHGEELCLDVLQTLVALLAGNEASKVSFRSLVGSGYITLERLLLDCCNEQPSLSLLNGLLDLLVDGNFIIPFNMVIQNEDAVTLFFNILQQCNEKLQCYGLDTFYYLVKESTSNRASCIKAGLLSLLLDWFGLEESKLLISKIGQLIQMIGGHSLTGKAIRKIFALLRSTEDGARPTHSSLLLNTVRGMLKDEGPAVFFELNGRDSGIAITTPLHWPSNRGFTFSCWARVESFPGNNEVMGLFSFLTESGKGCTALLDEERLTIETSTGKRQVASVRHKLSPKRWYFLCITHSTGRTFSGGHTLRYYVDATPVGNEKLRYPKVTEPLTCCTVGASAPFTVSEDNNEVITHRLSLPFCGQLGPVYLFDDVLSSNHIYGIFSLGPTYMYTFLDAEVGHVQENILTHGILDAKEGLAPKMVFGFNAQASSSKNLFDISPLLDQSKDQNSYEATIMAGTQLCYRRILRDILDCVGGVSVFFPLLTQLDQPIMRTSVHTRGEVVYSDFWFSDHVAAEVIELIASVLDGNLGNQQFMCNISGFAILGFLLQSVSPQQLTHNVVSALGHLLTIMGKSDSNVSQMLLKDILLKIFLNPHIWIYTQFHVQRELYMFLLNYFEINFKVLGSHFGLPRILDIICQFYWDTAKSRQAFGNKPLLHPVTKETIGERPRLEEIGKIRLLLLSLAEIVLRHNVLKSDVKALAAFLDKSEDLMCIEDVLHMFLRLVSHKPFLATFLEHIHSLGGCQIFLNILERQTEVVRLQGLQVMGRLLVGIPIEKKGIRLFSLGGGSTKSSIENQLKEKSKLEPIFGAIADRLLKFPFTDAVCAVLFDILLGGASPKQVLQKAHLLEEQGDKKNSVNGPSSNFFLPQILGILFKFILNCQDFATRECILRDLQKLLEANQFNSDSLISEYGWQAWFLSVLSDVQSKKHQIAECFETPTTQATEEMLIRTCLSIVHCHCICNVKGGWHHIEQTMNFMLLYLEQAQLSGTTLMHEILGDLIQGLLDISIKQNLFSVQPCRDNTLYLLSIIDEILIKDTLNSIPFPGNILSEELVEDLYSSEGYELVTPTESSGKMQAVAENLSEICDDSRAVKKSSSIDHMKGWQHFDNQDIMIDDSCWQLYDKVWTLISAINGLGPRKRTVDTTTIGPSLGQRARGLVESLNMPAAEMAAAVVSGGLAGVVNINSNKLVDKAIRLRGEKCPRILFRLVLLYVYKADLERASRCVQQFVSLLPHLFSNDNEQIKNRLQLFIWALLDARAQVGRLDDGARFHFISQLIRESVKHGKSVLAMSISGRDNGQDSNSILNETGSLKSLLQKDKVVSAARDEINYMRSSMAERVKEVQELRIELDEMSHLECLQKKQFEDELQSNLRMIFSSDGNRRAALRLAYDEDQQAIADKWCHMFRDLTDERGPWSSTPFPSNILTRWKLDKTEDPYRRRLKLKRNYRFDEQLCHPPSTFMRGDSEVGQNVDNFHVGMGSNVLGEVKTFLLKGLRGISEEEVLDVPGSEEDDPLNTESAAGEVSPLYQTARHIDDYDVKTEEAVSDNRQEQNWKFSEAGEDEVLLSVSCVVITPKRKMAGHLDVMRTSMHFYGEFVVEGTGGSRVFNSQGGLNYPDNVESDHTERSTKHKFYIVHGDGDSEKGNPMERLDPVRQQAFSGKQAKDVKRHRRWDICKVKAAHSARYLLQYTAVEIFFNSSVPPVFMNFASQDRANDVGRMIVSLSNEASFPKSSSRSRDEIIHYVDKRLAIEMAERARDVWRRREMSNFEYLMILNTLAGRSYNDLTQYPVFPWILADYTSQTLDFNKPTTFRDLSKPVGALDMKRFEVFEERYRNFCDPDIPSFYYGSHYSSMGSVLYYLLRLEPFTTLHRNLQGGKFDHADRLFHSISATYANCLSNTSDVKELIPEFFYMPEFLVNSNEYYLGVKQDGEVLGDVLLPPWAKDSHEEFIYKNREALESEFVSLNLHHWVDLIFGYKQRGKPAVEAANVFYHLTYEGAVDLEAMEDILQRAAVEDQIANFGQTPIQLFRKKHPKRGPPTPIARPLYYAPGSITLTSVLPAVFQPPSAIIFICVMDSTIILVSQGLVMSAKMWLTPQLQAGGNFTFSSSQEPFFGIGSDLIIPRKISSPLAENLELGTQCFATLQVRSSSFLLSCGHWENSFRVISLSDGRTVQSIRKHKDLVTCVSVATDGSVVVTGSHDTTVMVWEVTQSTRIVNKKARDALSFQDRSRKEHILSDKPCHILCGHDDVVTCVAVSVELDLVASGSKDKSCILHTLREGRYVRSIHHPNGNALSKMVISQHGRLVLFSNDDLNLLLFSINGKHLATSESNCRLNCMDLSSCGEFLVCGGDKGQIILHSMHSLEVLKRYDASGKVILSLSVTPEDCFLVGTQDGSLLMYSIETPQHRKNNVTQNAKVRRFAAG